MDIKNLISSYASWLKQETGWENILAGKPGSGNKRVYKRATVLEYYDTYTATGLLSGSRDRG